MKKVWDHDFLQYEYTNLRYKLTHILHWDDPYYSVCILKLMTLI